MHLDRMPIHALLIVCLVLTASACVETPSTPAPASTASTAPPPMADATLPKALRAKLTDPPAKRLDVWITADGVHVDEGPLFDATPANRRAQLWPRGRPTVAKVAPLAAGALDETGMARLRSTLTGSTQRGANPADLQLMASETTPYSTVLAVLGEARAVGYKRWWVRARGRTTTGAFRVRRARWCTQALSAPIPCTITHAWVTDTATVLQNRSHTEAACGVPPAPAPPKPDGPLFKGERGVCKQLRHRDKQVAAAIIPPHRQRMIAGKICAHGTVAAWPTTTWTQVVEVADGLRAAGHETIALSAAAQGETCVPDPVAPASGAPASGAPASIAPTSGAPASAAPPTAAPKSTP